MRLTRILGRPLAVYLSEAGESAPKIMPKLPRLGDRIDSALGETLEIASPSCLIQVDETYDGVI